jgi:hypothetical protein
MELGVFSLSDIFPGSIDTAASRIDDIISYGILAEKRGLDVFGLGEHHTRAFAISSPMCRRCRASSFEASSRGHRNRPSQPPSTAACPDTTRSALSLTATTST